RKLELEIQKLERELIPADQVRDVISSMTTRARAILLGIPAAQAGRANPQDPKRAEDAIRDGIYEALTELADDPFGGGALETAAETDGVGVGGRVPEVESGVQLGAGEMED